jgi:NAD-specific glutamate dehydrogenase
MSSSIETIEGWNEYKKEILNWQNDIEAAFNNVILKVLKKAYPFIVDVAEIGFHEFHYKIDFLMMKIIFFIKPEYFNVSHDMLDKDIRSMFEMMKLNEREIKTTKEVLTLEIRALAVPSE